MKNCLLFLLLFSSNLIPNILTAQTSQFTGTWTKLNTTYVFEFDLILKHQANGQVEGYFSWKVVQYDKKSPSSKQYYEDKIGMTAKEFVRGTYNPKTKEYQLHGYKKEDPNQIIGTDNYRLKVDQNGDIGGKTQSHGPWKGRINGKSVLMEIV